MMITPDAEKHPPMPLSEDTAQAWFMDVVGEVSDAVLIFTSELQPVLANPEAYRRLGISREVSLVQQTALAIVEPFSAAIWQMLGRAVAGDVPVREVVLDPRTNSWLHARVVRSGGAWLMLVISESNDHQHLAQTLDHAQQQGMDLDTAVLSEAERIEQLVSVRAKVLAEREEAMARDRRLAAIGQLAAGVMHDVNNALNPIMAAAYLLRHHAESPDAVRDYAERIRKSAEMGAATAARVGRFIRQEPRLDAADELMDLSLIAEELLELAEPMLQQRAGDASHVRLIRNFEIGVQMRGAPSDIREALLNLVTNAMDAMPRGGKLSVHTARDGSDVLVSVQDTGSGMTQHVRERAFEPFFTTKGAGGSGLGLAEVYGIVRRHRGVATIESGPDRGTLVTLRFPAEFGSTPRPSAVTGAEKTAPLHILIVEDHPEGRDFLRRLLQAEGHTVDAVENCASAREKLAQVSISKYALMLTDVGLSDGNGWDLAAFAKKEHPSLRVGIITGWEPGSNTGGAVGVEFVLRKPLRAAELLSFIAGGYSPAQPE